MSKGRSRKQQREDTKRHYKELAERTPSASAARAFVRKAYQSCSVEEYLRERGVTEIGQGKTAAIQSIEKGSAEA